MAVLTTQLMYCALPNLNAVIDRAGVIVGRRAGSRQCFSLFSYSYLFRFFFTSGSYGNRFNSRRRFFLKNTQLCSRK